ncbi:UDP-N-acetylglucosamine--N-acetylmuramyl-(pentapeptide) pyrophosphoryl-undecaprenol N-acetylglucosamine transferase [Dirofilaria immitis]
MLNGFYDYFFGSEDANRNNIKENVSVLTNSTELVAFTLPSGSSETKDDDWILLDGQLSSGRSTPVIVPEPDLIAIDDELSTVVSGSVRNLSNAIIPGI